MWSFHAYQIHIKMNFSFIFFTMLYVGKYNPATSMQRKRMTKTVLSMIWSDISNFL